MNEFMLTSNDLRNTEMEYHCKFEHNIVRIHHISIMIRIDILYTACCMGTQNVTPTLPGFQGLKCCTQYLDRHPIKSTFYPSNYYDA